MSESLKKMSTFPDRDTFSPGRQRTSSRAKVTEERAVAQRKKLDRERAERAKQIEQKNRKPAARTPAPKAGAQTMTISRALEAYIQDHIGGNQK